MGSMETEPEITRKGVHNAWTKSGLIWEHVEQNLIRYIPTSGYYAKVKIHGRKIRHSLGTSKLQPARRKLAIWLVKIRGTNKTGRGISTVGALAELWKIWLENKIQSDRTTSTRLENWDVIKKTWPKLPNTKLGRVTRFEVESWRDGMVKKHGYSHAQANLCLGTLRQIFRYAEERGLTLLDNPAVSVRQLRCYPRKIELPTKEEFEKLRQLIWKRAKRAGKVFDFLSLTGMRIRSSHAVTWGDVDWTNNKLSVNKSKNGGYTMPLFAPLKKFLVEIKPEDAKPGERITATDDINMVIYRGCDTLGMKRMSHHSLRHWFATGCIEKGVDIPTVSRWLGHKDGGALALRVYGHLRDEHSQQMAELIT